MRSKKYSPRETPKKCNRPYLVGENQGGLYLTCQGFNITLSVFALRKPGWDSIVQTPATGTSWLQDLMIWWQRLALEVKQKHQKDSRHRPSEISFYPFSNPSSWRGKTFFSTRCSPYNSLAGISICLQYTRRGAGMAEFVYWVDMDHGLLKHGDALDYACQKSTHARLLSLYLSSLSLSQKCSSVPRLLYWILVTPGPRRLWLAKASRSKDVRPDGQLCAWCISISLDRIILLAVVDSTCKLFSFKHFIVSFNLICGFQQSLQTTLSAIALLDQELEGFKIVTQQSTRARVGAIASQHPTRWWLCEQHYRSTCRLQYHCWGLQGSRFTNIIKYPEWNDGRPARIIDCWYLSCHTASEEFHHFTIPLGGALFSAEVLGGYQVPWTFLTGPSDGGQSAGVSARRKKRVSVRGRRLEASLLNWRLG